MTCTEADYLSAWQAQVAAARVAGRKRSALAEMYPPPPAPPGKRKPYKRNRRRTKT